MVAAVGGNSGEFNFQKLGIWISKDLKVYGRADVRNQIKSNSL